MGLLDLYMGKVTRVGKQLVGSSVFLILVRPLVLSDPGCAEKRVVKFGDNIEDLNYYPGT